MHTGETTQNHVSRHKNAFYTGIMDIIVSTSTTRDLDI